MKCKQIPHGPENLNCHRCLPEKVPMSEVCHKCSLWVAMHKEDQETKEKIIEWNCADAWRLIGQFEMAKMINRTAATTASFRNEMVALNVAGINAAARLHQIQERSAPVLIESIS